MSTIIVLVVMLALCACNLSPLINIDSIGPLPAYTVNTSSTRVPSGVVKTSEGAYILKDMQTGVAVDVQNPSNLVLIDAVDSKNPGVPDITAQANDFSRAILTGKMPVFDTSSYKTNDMYFQSPSYDILKLIWHGKYTDNGGEKFSESLIGICRSIITDTMTDYQKVLAIHDFVSYNVNYNFEALEAATAGGSVSDSNFNIIGAAYNRKAVCDGYATMFSLLCRIEGIESVRVLGAVYNYYADGSPFTLNPYINHAWNKVNIDPDGDGPIEKQWFNVDTTYDRYSINMGTAVNSYLSHAYFMLSDENIRAQVPTQLSGESGTVSGYQTRVQGMLSGGSYSGGIERYKGDSEITDSGDTGNLTEFDTEYYAADVTYDYFGNTRFNHAASGNMILKLNSEEELVALFEELNKQTPKVGKIEVQLAFDETESATHISSFKKAYAKMDSAQYPASQTYCRRAARNVYFCLIYK